LDLSDASKDVATISEKVDPATGQVTLPTGSPRKWFSDIAGGPASEYNRLIIFTSIISTLSDAELLAVAEALNNAVSRDGLDYALWQLLIAVDEEIRKRLDDENKPPGDEKMK